MAFPTYFSNLRRNLLVLIVIITSLIWFYSGIFLSADTHVPLYEKGYYDRMLNVWDSVMDYSDTRHLILIPYVTIIFLMDVIFTIFTSDLQFKLQLLQFALFTLSGIAIVFGIEKISFYLANKKKFSTNSIMYEVLVFLITLFYVFNIWAITSIWRPFWPYLFHYSFFPLLIYCFLMLCENISINQVIKLAIVCFFVSIGYVIPFSLVFDIIFLSLLALTLKIPFMRLIKSISSFVIIISVCLLPFIFVTVYDTTSIISTASRIQELAPINALLQYNSPHLIRAFGLTGYPPFYDSSHWYPNLLFFHEYVYILIFILFILIPLLLNREILSDPTVLFLLAFFLVMLGLISGYNISVLHNLVLGFFSLPFVGMLRSVYVRFGEYLVISLFLLFTLSWLALLQKDISNINKIKKYELTFQVLGVLFVIFAIIPLLISSWMLIPWESFNQSTPPIHTSIPSSYIDLFDQLGNISKNSGDLVIVPLPTNFQQTEWYQGPPLFALGAFGKALDPEKQPEQIKTILSRMILSNHTIELASPFVIILSDDLLIKTQNERQLAKVTKHLSKQYGFRRLDLQESLNSSVSIFYQPEYISPFLVLTSIPQSVFKREIIEVYNQENYFATYNLPNYYSYVLPSELLGNLSITSDFEYFTNKSDERYLYPLSISYFDQNLNKTQIYYLYLRFFDFDGKSKIEIGSGKNWGYHKTFEYEFTKLNESHSKNIRFFYDQNSSYVILDDHTLFFFDEYIQNPLSNEFDRIVHKNLSRMTEIQFRSTHKINDTLYLNRLIVTYPDEFLSAEEVYLELDNAAYLELDSYIEIKPNKYKIDINATEPFILSFAKGYSPLWGVYDKDKTFKSKSIPLYGVINGFYINKTGNYELIIEYGSEKWFELGLFSSLSLIFLFFCFCMYRWIKNLPRKKELKFDKGHPLTETIEDLYSKNKISHSEAEQYLMKSYSRKETYQILKDWRNKKGELKTNIK